MKYFFLGSKFSVFSHCNRRTISYKVKKSLLYALAKMEQGCKNEPEKVNFVKKGQPLHCPRFMIQVLANGASESGGIIVQTGKSSYLFNCGEGAQRCAASYGIKLFKTYAAFITSQTWSNIGGIMGVALTLQSLGMKKFLVYGPPALKQMIGGWESFVLLKSLTVQVVADKTKLGFDDGCLKVEFVRLYCSSTVSTHKSNSDSLLNVDVEQNINFEDSKSKNSHAGPTTPNEESDMYVQCYICKTPHFGQHLDVEECLKKGLEVGPILNILKNNKSVTLTNGKVVYLDEVCTSSGEYKVFIVLECPSERYLDSLVNEKAFAAYQEFGSEPADLIIHFTPEKIINEPLYQEWMSKFPKTTKHLIINSENVFADLVPVYQIQTKLNYLNQEIFPLLNNNDLPIIKEELCGKMGKATILNMFGCMDEETEINVAEELERGNSEFSARKTLQSCPQIFQDVNGMSVIRPLPTLSLHYHPKQKCDYRHNIAYNPFSCINEMKSLDNITEDLNDLVDFNRKWKASDEYKNLSDYPKILFLGTGSSMPSRYRATSAIVVYMNEDNLFLLDCGEGTYQQLLRFFGKEKMPEFMKKLKMIYISHHHADHHMGMVNILLMRQKLLAGCENPGNIILLIPSTISDWLYAAENIFKSVLTNTTIVKNSQLGRDYCGILEALNEIGVSKLRVCRVDHCRNSSGISITDHNNFKITYSGDCKPSLPLIEIGEGSDILIHEATFEDDLTGMAQQKSHSTISQAIEVGKKMGAKFTVLTHFSQRYASIPNMADNIPGNVTIAFDNMMVNAKTLPVSQKMLQFYKVVFADKIEKLNTKQLKRSVRRENEVQEFTKIRVTS